MPVLSRLKGPLPAWFAASGTARVAVLRGLWPAAVGEVLAAHAEIAALDGQTLRLRVEPGPWAKTVRDLRLDLLRRLSESAGPLAPTRITVSEGAIRAPRKRGREGGAA
jgi:hypothetical protein